MDYKDINDYEVLYMIKENDEDACLLLYKKYKPIIDKKIYKWSSVLKKLGINQMDVRQELYLAFTKAVNKYSEDNNTLFYTYVNILLDGHIKNLIKNATKKDLEVDYIVYNDEDEEMSLFDLVSDDSYDPCQNFDVTNLVNLMRDFSSSLDMERAIIFEMHISGFKNKEIGSVVDKTPVNVSVEIGRIMKKFKKILVKNDYLVI